MFSCSKDSESEEEPNTYQTLIETLDGKMFRFGESENFKYYRFIHFLKENKYQVIFSLVILSLF